MKPSKGSRNRISGGSYMCWMDFHNAILRCGFLCTLLIPALFVSILFYGNHAEGYHAPSLPPRAITPVYASRLSRHSIFLLLCYHTRAITLHNTRTPGHHTRHSSYFVVYLSPAITPPVLLHLHHHRGATRTNLLHTPAAHVEPCQPDTMPRTTCKLRPGTMLHCCKSWVLFISSV